MAIQQCQTIKVNIDILKLGAFLRNTVLVMQKTLRGFSKNFGEKVWTN